MRQPISPAEAVTAPRTRPAGPLISFLSKLPMVEGWRERTVWLDRRKGFKENFFGASATYQARVREIERLLEEKDPEGHYHSRRIHAEERASLEWICEARALPRGGATSDELRDIGLRVEPENTYMGALRLVDLPEGWDMIPEEPDPISPITDHGSVIDDKGMKRLHVFYRASIRNDTQKGYVRVWDYPDLDPEL